MSSYNGSISGGRSSNNININSSTSKCNDAQPELRRITVNGDAVSQNAMSVANLAVNVIAELLASSQPIKTRLLNESL